MIPFKKINYEQSDRYPKYIVIHHTDCLMKDKEFQYDENGMQVTKYHALNYRKTKSESNFHFIIEKQGSDYNAIVSQPILTKCKFPDLSEEFENSVHIAVFGNYNKDIPPNRLYEVIAYRVIVQLFRLFYLRETDVLLHTSISSDPNVTCPGEFFEMSKLKSYIRKFKRTQTIKRSK